MHNVYQQILGLPAVCLFDDVLTTPRRATYHDGSNIENSYIYWPSVDGHFCGQH
jgi:hypothetical protein